MWPRRSYAGPDGDRVVLRYADPDSLARWLVGYGADVVVLDPHEVRKATVARLRDWSTSSPTVSWVRPDRCRVEPAGEHTDPG